MIEIWIKLKLQNWVSPLGIINFQDSKFDLD